uniref:Uncharacterized protein n=1 Tax=Panagrolaimus sp. ES5 TaxID=591445 RepID=A0AC34FVW2_9BILA
MPDYVCVNVQFSITNPDPQKCSPNLNTPFAFALNEPYFELHAHSSNSRYETWNEIFYGYADDGTFSIDDGTFFTPQNPSVSQITNDRTSFTNVTHTCTSFVSAPEAPITPRCKNFISETTVLNVDKSIYANSTGIYTFNNGNDMIVAANFTGPKDYYIIFWVNGQACESKYNSCKVQNFKGNDGKIIINSAIIKDVGSEDIGSFVPMLGRIVIRANQTLIKEGIPFTPSNNCLFSNHKFGKNQISNTKFCCTEFENV